MNRHLLFGVALAVFGLAAAPLFSQTQTTTTSSSSSGYIQTSKIVGMKVKTHSGEDVGVVKDVVLDRSNGCMAYTVLSTGGTGTRITGQSKMVAVPWSVYTTSPDTTYLTTTVERDRIYNAPVFEYARIGDTSYTSTVYSTFGVSAGAGVGYSGSTTTTGAATTTGSTTQSQTSSQSSTAASPSASVGASASASPGMSASPAASASATAAPSASASASTSPEASTSKSTHSAKGEKSPVSPRHKGDEPMSGSGSTHTESGSEGTSSTGKSSKSKKGSSAERSTSEESSSAESSESPSGKKSSHKKSGSSSEGTTTEPSPGEQE